MKIKKLIPLLVCLFLFSSCQSLFQSFYERVDDPKGVFISGDALKNVYAYDLYRRQFQDEKARIRYLINLIRFSEVIFIRNREAFSGGKAARWLEFKLYKFPNEAKTAKAFVKNLAGHSKNTGKPYLVVLPNGKRYLLRSLLTNELNRLDEAEALAKKAKRSREVIITAISNISEKTLPKISPINPYVSPASYTAKEENLEIQPA